MWTREQLKENAKGRLRYYYWTGVLVCLIAGLLTGGSGGSASSAGVNVQTQQVVGGQEVSAAAALFASLIGLFAMAVAVAVSAFVGNVIIVGLNRFFMESREHNASVGVLFSGFRGDYLNVVKVQFLTNLSIFLWSLLLVIPGLVKSYEYFMVPYLLAENPNMSTSRAKELSSWMTEGEKWNIFVLGLSFMGWALLAAFTCGIGGIFLEPYIQATYAELYEAMREKALAAGVTTYQELPGFGGTF